MSTWFLIIYFGIGSTPSVPITVGPFPYAECHALEKQIPAETHPSAKVVCIDLKAH